jgi:hypothetical protein
MSGLKTSLNRRLTIRDGVGVIALIAALAVTGYYGYQFVAAKLLEAKVESALPEVCTAVRAQRATIVDAIENYKKEFGFYPRDNVVSRQPVVVNAYTNSLLYEIVGTVIDDKGMVHLPGQETAAFDFVKQFLNTTGFVNSGTSTGAVKRFFSLENSAVRQIHDDPDVFAVGYHITSPNVPFETYLEFEFGPWQYVSSAPVHSPGKFDLWIEVKTKKHAMVIGNWKEVE